MGYKQVRWFAWLLLAVSSYAQMPAFDPLTIGLGARTLGMGKTYAAVAEETNNPAGLGEIDNFKFASMAGTLLEDVNYTVLKAVCPLGNQSAASISYVGGFVSGIEIRDSAGTLSRKANFGNNVLFASYGKKFGDRTSFGINLKYHFIDGTEIDSGDGHGWNLDLGLLQSDLGCVSLGLIGQNLLSSSKITYQNGEEENLPMSIRAGAKIYLLGNSYKAALHSPMELISVVDVEFNLKNTSPMNLYGGIEFSPIPALAIRSGFDQGIFSAGLSLRLAGLGLHYAYNPSAQYFSLTFEERDLAPQELPDQIACKTPPLVIK